tara:strand:- start:366 stop:917 length:552 start_codon:yes stop_codon:yes gene_type:complete
MHNDWGAVELTVHGRELIVDAGSYCYTSNPELREQFRSNEAHSALIVDHEDPVQFSGLFEVAESRTTVNTTVLTNGVETEIAGLSSLRRRKVLHEQNRVLVIDECASASRVQFNLAPGVGYSVGTNEFTVNGKASGLFLKYVGTETPILLPGYYSRQYGLRESNVMLALRRTEQRSEVRIEWE